MATNKTTTFIEKYKNKTLEPIVSQLLSEAEINTDTSKAETRQKTFQKVKITGTRMQYFTDELRLKMSVREITNSKPNGTGSLNDPVFGPPHRRIRCQTCNQSQNSCPGHCGHIRLPRPIYDADQIKNTVNYLRSVCHECSAKLLTDEEILSMDIKHLTGSDRLKEIAEKSVSRRCNKKIVEKRIIDGEEVEVVTLCPKNKVVKQQKIFDSYKIVRIDNDKPIVWNIKIVNEVLKSINKHDIKMLGGSDIVHPESGIMEIYLVMSKNLRCSNYLGSMAIDDQYTEVLRKVMEQIAKYKEDENKIKINTTNIREQALVGIYNKSIVELTRNEDKNLSKIISDKDLFMKILKLLSKFDQNESGFNDIKRWINIINDYLDDDDDELEPPKNQLYIGLTELIKKKGRSKKNEDYSIVSSLMVIINNMFNYRINHKAITFDKVYDELNQKDESDPLDKHMNIIELVLNGLKNNSSKKVKVPGKEIPIKGFNEKFGDKNDGLFRGVAMGKRPNFVCRTVLNPNPKLKFEEIGIPRRYRTFLTVNETITIYNRERLIKLYDEGDIVGIVPKIKNFVGGFLSVKNEELRIKSKHLMIIGNVIIRYLQDGDIININRQPTLSKFSYLTGKVKFFDNEVLGLTMHLTTPLNADFDGDEGVGIALQSIGAQTEGRFLSNVGSNIISTHANRNILGLVFNCIVSVYMLSKFVIEIDDFDFNEAIKKCLIDDDETKKRLLTFEKRCNKYGISPRSTRALFSLVLPSDFCYYRKLDDEFDTNGKKIKVDPVEIKEGILVSGVLSKSDIGPVGNSIIHFLHKEYHPDIVKKFLTEGQFICEWFIKWHGLSFTYKDCYPSLEIRNKIKVLTEQEIEKVELELEVIGDEHPSMTQMEKIHRNTKRVMIFSNVNTLGKKLALSILPDNSALNMLCTSGAKGSTINISQINSAVGIQLSGGQTQEHSLSNGRRLMPWFSHKDKSLIASGFVDKSFEEGISPPGFYACSVSSREGSINTSLKTAKIGDMQHQLCKVLEDISIKDDGSIRNSKGSMFQPIAELGYKVDELINVKTVKGNSVSFINLDNIARKLNLRKGYDLTKNGYIYRE